MSFIRTVCGDILAEDAGICYGHEHVVLRGSHIEQNFPDFLLADLDKICEELKELRWFGVQTMIDAMPIDAGRSAVDLAEVSKASDINIVTATGLHLRKYYPTRHWYDEITEDELTARFVGEIESSVVDEGLDTGKTAGVIKVAGSLGRLNGAECRNFAAAGRTQSLTGCPILTHTEEGTAALEQVRILVESGADPKHIVLSHLDRIDDPGYHREVLSTGVRLEYDSSFRRQSVTQQLVLQLAPEFPDSLILGMDAAKRGYWRSFGGSPGLAYIVRDFAPKLLDLGLAPNLLHRILVDNPASAYSFVSRAGKE